MSENTHQTRTAQELAREYVLACDAYRAAYRLTLASTDKPIEDRADLEIAAEQASRAMCNAKRAMDAALKVAA